MCVCVCVCVCIYIYIYKYIYIYSFSCTKNLFGQTVWAVKYTDCTSAEK